MLVVQHRVNDLLQPGDEPDYAEVDVQVNEANEFIVRHDFCGPSVYLDTYLKTNMNIKKFFVNIKQSLALKQLREISYMFDDRLIGIFDVPGPHCYYAEQGGLLVYHRLSEFERYSPKLTRYWVDPLKDQRWFDYQKLINKTVRGDRLMICLPSLHGFGPEREEEVCGYLLHEYGERTFLGMVTKFPKLVSSVYQVHKDR